MIHRLIFFHIYNSYYKNGTYRNDIPHLTAFFIVGAGFSMLILTVILFTSKVLFGATFSKLVVMSIFVAPMPLFTYQYLYKSKYKLIYKEFRKSKWDTLRVKVMCWLLPLVGFISIVLYSYAFNR